MGKTETQRSRVTGRRWNMQPLCLALCMCMCMCVVERGNSQLTGSPHPLQDPLDTRLYADPSLPQAGSWRASGLPSGPPQLPPVVTGPSLDTARAHMLALGPQKLLAQDEEGDT